ncbi:MAG: PEP-CTERM sorting domain-containing protein [Pirellulales bacterium]|nr:PEP-CTERM sorting domain-containing protein [Pirellulales bacterium]
MGRILTTINGLGLHHSGMLPRRMPHWPKLASGMLAWGMVLICLGLFTPTNSTAGEIKPIIYTGMQVPGLAPGVVFAPYYFTSNFFNFSSLGVLQGNYYTNDPVNNYAMIYYNRATGLNVPAFSFKQFYNAAQPQGENIVYAKEGNLFVGKPGAFNNIQQVGVAANGTPSNDLVTEFSAVNFITQNQLELFEKTTLSPGGRTRVTDISGTTLSVLPQFPFSITDTFNPAFNTNRASRTRLLSATEYTAYDSVENSVWYHLDGVNYRIGSLPSGSDTSRAAFTALRTNQTINYFYTTPNNLQTVTYDTSTRIPTDVFLTSTWPGDSSIPIGQTQYGMYKSVYDDTTWISFSKFSQRDKATVYTFNSDATFTRIFGDDFVHPNHEQNTTKYIYTFNLHLSDQNDILFSYDTDNDPATNNSYVVARKRDGTFVTISNPGEVVDLPDGTSRTVKNHVKVIGIDQWNRAYFQVTFTDGTDGLLYSDILAVPEPAHLGLIGGSLALGWVFFRCRRKKIDEPKAR